MASAGYPANGATRNGLPAPKAVGPFAICLISDRMRMDEPRGLPWFLCLNALPGLMPFSAHRITFNAAANLPQRANLGRGGL